jgi:glycosidase
MWHQGKTGYYYGYFDASMPDLNYNNPAVTAEMEKVTKFWLDQGVDGFRIDAAKHLIEEGNKLENTKSTHQWFKQYYTFYKSVNPEVYMVGEVAGSDATQVSLYTGNQLDMIFDFELASGFVNSANGGANSGVNSAIKFVLMDAPSWKFATFLTNHDQNRVMSVLGGNVEKAKVAAALLLTSPGTPFIYYGEEIGMQGVKPDEDIRRPMQWADGANAGFSSGKPWRALDATNLKANVQTELADPNSLLNFYTELIHLREQNPALGGGSLALAQADNPGIYAVFRQNGEQNLLVLINLKGESISNFHLDLAKTGLADGEYTLNPLYGNEKPNNLTITTGGVSGYAPLTSILPYSIYIFQLSHP